MKNNTTVIRTCAVQGPPGLSAYQLAIRNGFTGSEEEWLDSMKAVLRASETLTTLSSEWSSVIDSVEWPSGSYSVTVRSTAINGNTVFSGTFPWCLQEYSVIKPSDVISLNSHGNDDVIIELRFDYSSYGRTTLEIRSIGSEVPSSVDIKITQIG